MWAVKFWAVKFWAVAVVGILAGCMSAVAQMPSKGVEWHELTSEHFTVWSDADQRQVRELIGELEKVRQVIVGASFPSAPNNARNFVIVLRDDGELTEFSSTGQPRAYARTAEAPLWQPMVVMSAFSNFQRTNTQTAHELTHVISSGVIHFQPRWLAEGLAQYFETLQIDGDGAAHVGGAPAKRGEPRPLPNLVSMPALFAWKGVNEHERSEYQTSWALVTFLINNHRGELLRYLDLLEAEGPRDEMSAQEAEQLWDKAFPTLPASEVHEELVHWLTSGHHSVYHFRVDQRAWPIAERSLSDADVHAARGMLRLFQGRRGEADGELAAALTADPTNVLGWVMKAALGGTALSSDQVRAITVEHHTDWRAWWIAATAHANRDRDEHELSSARMKACSLIVDNAALVMPPELVPAAHGRRAQDGCQELLRKPQPRAPSQTGILTFNITKSGVVELNGKRLDHVDIDNVLEDTFAKNRNTEVVLRVSHEAAASAFQTIFDRATAIGYKVSMTTY
jgi:hypothetical protein